MTAANFQKNKKYRAADRDLMTAIVVCNGPGNIGSAFKKFRNIPKPSVGKGYNDFLLFAAKFPGITAINFYEKVKAPGATKGAFIEKIHF